MIFPLIVENEAQLVAYLDAERKDFADRCRNLADKYETQALETYDGTSVELEGRAGGLRIAAAFAEVSLEMSV